MSVLKISFVNAQSLVDGISLVADELGFDIVD